MTKQDNLKELVDLIKKRVKSAPLAKPSLRLVTAAESAPPDDDAVTRRCRIERIRWLARAYRLQPIVAQHCFGVLGVDHLSTPKLQALHKALETARECPEFDVSWDEAGLIQTTYEETFAK